MVGYFESEAYQRRFSYVVAACYTCTCTKKQPYNLNITAPGRSVHLPKMLARLSDSRMVTYVACHRLGKVFRQLWYSLRMGPLPFRGVSELFRELAYRLHKQSVEVFGRGHR